MHWKANSRSRPLRLAVICLPLLLAGCGAPPAVMIASLAFDTAVLASTGKTPPEHVASAAFGRDCAVRHVFTSGTVCQPETLMAGELVSGYQEAARDSNRVDAATLN